MSERIDAGVLLLYGEQAEITTEHRGAEDPERVPVARLIADTGIPRARQADSQLVAVISDKGQIERFERARTATQTPPGIETSVGRSSSKHA